MREKLKGALIHLCIGFGVAALVIGLNWDRELSMAHRLCDGFFVAAVLLLGFGGLRFVGNQGVFDVMSYGIKSALDVYMPFLKMNSPLDARQEEFADYQERKRAERKSPAEMLWAGLAHAVISGVCFAVYLLTA